MSEANVPDPQAAPLRDLVDIQKEYDELCKKAGRCHYQIEVYKSDLAMTTDRINKVNIEAAQRRALDAQQKAAQDVVK